VTNQEYPCPAAAPIEQQSDFMLLCMCVFGEARNQTFDAMVGVGNVVKNRLNAQTYFGKTWHEVILKPWQFSSFNTNDPNRSKLLNPLAHENVKVWNRCCEAAEIVYDNRVADNTGTALFYFSTPLTEPPKTWGTVIHTVTLDGLHFYKLP
jgi:spore germination cell wall hydrolase CwlJ-like protein